MVLRGLSKFFGNFHTNYFRLNTWTRAMEEAKEQNCLVREGGAVIEPQKKGGKESAFYNPAQVINRDLSLMMIEWYIQSKRGTPGEGDISYVECLSASGLRSIRVAKEVEGLKTIIANDIEPVAVERMKKNMSLSGLEPGRITLSCDDANALLYKVRSISPVD